MQSRPAETAVKSNVESLSCDACGHADAVQIGDRVLCQDCYQGCGSCCAGGEEDEEKQTNNPPTTRTAS
jgi:hypothetical protein